MNRTIHSLKQLKTTPSQVAAEAAKRIWTMSYDRMAGTKSNSTPRHRLEIIKEVKAFGPRAEQLIKAQPLYKAALWMAVR